MTVKYFPMRKFVHFLQNVGHIGANYAVPGPLSHRMDPLLLDGHNSSGLADVRIYTFLDSYASVVYVNMLVIICCII